jgi:uncharacterized protein
LIDDDWIDFFKVHDVRVGVSLDGPRDLHDRNRRYRNGAGSYERTTQGIARLRARSYPFHFIGVITAQSLSRGPELCRHYLNFQPTAIGLNIEEVEAQNRRSSLEGAFSQERYEHFVSAFLEEAARFGEQTVLLRDFQRTMSSLIAGAPEDNDQVIPLRMVNVAFNGDISTFSPELLALNPSERQRFIFGNVHSCRSLTHILADRRFAAAYSEIRRGVDRCADSCDYFQYCGGGAPVNKLSEKGAMDVTETIYCKLTKKAWIDVCLRLATRSGSGFELATTS